VKLDAGRATGLTAMSTAALGSIALVAQASWQLHVVGWMLAALLGLGGYAFYRSREVRGSVTAGFRNPVALTRTVSALALALLLLAGTHGYFLATEVAKV
jgi:hypothetical protein